MPDTPTRERRSIPWLAAAAIVLVTTVALRCEGRIWWCACGSPRPWAADVWSSHCSQHLVDAYSVTHVSHGLIFFWLFAWLLPRWRVASRLVCALALAAAWEVAENSAFVIERYRTETMSLEYLGDSVANALADVAFCALGFLAAGRLGLVRTVALFVATELLLLLWIRDNLTLNVLMLITPIDSIKAWQTFGHR